MRIVFLGHPTFLSSQSMPRFLQMLTEGMKIRGHEVEVWQPYPFFIKLPTPLSFKKWMGYLDQYIIFPVVIKLRSLRCDTNTLFVFTDNALGPWVPFLKNRKHVIHCHDFLAQMSAIDEISENPTSWTGKIYQKFIRNGYRQANNFISVSNKTEIDLLRFLKHKPHISNVIYNGLSRPFTPHNVSLSRKYLGEKLNLQLSNGYILHVGGNQWYKNRLVVVKLYNEWRRGHSTKIPLLLIGEKPTEELQCFVDSSNFKNDIHFCSNVSDNDIDYAYSGASVLLFPSLAEGFGWPIAEAMACGCPVLTTNLAPMNEVGGRVAFYMDRLTVDQEIPSSLISILESIVNLSDEFKEDLRRKGFEYVTKFDSTIALDSIEETYKKIVYSSVI